MIEKQIPLTIEMENVISRVYSATSPYEVLGVSPRASDNEINCCFKKLALICHPDKSTHHQAEEIFKRINKARSDILNGGLEEKLLQQRDLYAKMARIIAEIKAERKAEHERERAFVEKWGQCSDDQWRDDGKEGWTILPPKRQNPNRRRKH